MKTKQTTIRLDEETEQLLKLLQKATKRHSVTNVIEWLVYEEAKRQNLIEWLVYEKAKRQNLIEK